MLPLSTISLLEFGSVPTVWYILSFILLTLLYYISNISTKKKWHVNWSRFRLSMLPITDWLIRTNCYIYYILWQENIFHGLSKKWYLEMMIIKKLNDCYSRNSLYRTTLDIYKNVRFIISWSRHFVYCSNKDILQLETTINHDLRHARIV